MAKVRHVQIEGFRSIHSVYFEFPQNAPLVLVGENNAGKSNILAAIEFVLGEFWPGSRMPDTTDFQDRNPEESIFIRIDFRTPLAKKYLALNWRYVPKAKNPQEAIEFRPVYANTGEEAKHYISNVDRSDCICIYVQAERELGYVLSYRSKYTMLSKLMHRFHTALQQETEITDELRKQFETTKACFNRIETFAKFQNTLRAEFSDLIASMTYQLEIDFEAYNPANFFHALRVQAKEGTEPRSFDELGTGEQQLLALAFAKAYAREFHSNVLLAIEEPESHLHPLAQEWLAVKLRELARSDDVQVIITTHSPIFIDIANLDGLVLVTKDEVGGTYAKQISRNSLVKHCLKQKAHPEKVNESNIYEFYAANTTKEILEGFFANKVVLVEGPTEALALPIYLKTVLLDCLRERICFIPVGGKGNLARYWRLFTAFEIPVYVVFDNDSEDDKKGEKREDILNAIGYSGEISDILFSETLFIASHFAVFGLDFENTMRGIFAQDDYESLEREAREFMGLDPEDKKTCKPLVARYVAKQLAERFNDRMEGLCQEYGEEKLLAEAYQFLDVTEEPTNSRTLITRYIIQRLAIEYEQPAWKSILELSEMIASVGTVQT